MEHKLLKAYVSLDLETTGLDPKTDSIIEIGALKIVDGMEREAFSTFVKPARQIPERITQLTGITARDVEDAPEAEAVMPGLLEFIGELPLLGHSVLFDYSFIKRTAVNLGLCGGKRGAQMQMSAVDTLRIARRYLPDLKSRSLPFLCGHYGISHRAHRALEDARATYELFLKLWESFGEADAESGLTSFEPVPLQYKCKRESPATQQQKERLYQLLERHKLNVGYDVERLTRNQASRYTDLILAECGVCADGRLNADSRRAR